MQARQQQPHADCTSPKTFGSLSDGPHTVSFRAQDAAGNPDLTPASRTFTVDATAPDTTIDSGPATAPRTTNSADFTFHAAGDTAKFQCKLDSGSYADGLLQLPKTFGSLGDGSHTVSFRAQDAAGNPDQTPATRTFTVDTTPPDDSGPSGTTNDAGPSFTFSSPDNSASFQCRLDSNNAADWASGSSPKAYSSLADGTHTFEVRAVDTAGNPDPTPASRTFTVDTTPAPAAPTITATGPASPANNNSPKVKGTAAAGTTVKIYASGTCSGSPVAQGSAGASRLPGDHGLRGRQHDDPVQRHRHRCCRTDPPRARTRSPTSRTRLRRRPRRSPPPARPRRPTTTPPRSRAPPRRARR